MIERHVELHADRQHDVLFLRRAAPAAISPAHRAIELLHELVRVAAELVEDRGHVGAIAPDEALAALLTVAKRVLAEAGSTETGAAKATHASAHSAHAHAHAAAKATHSAAHSAHAQAAAKATHSAHAATHIFHASAAESTHAHATGLTAAPTELRQCGRGSGH